MNKITQKLYFSFFPRKCIACGEVINYRQEYCEGCRSKMPFIPDERCLLCGMGKVDCNCRKNKAHYDVILAPFYYEGGAKNAVLKLKSYPVYAKPLARECVRVIERFPLENPPDLVCNVPMWQGKIKENGFDHSAVLAKEIAAFIGVPYRECLRVLYRPDAQHKLDWKLRAGNVRGIYDVISELELKDKNILLVDDIKTSGATLGECALMLKLYGAKSVSAVAFAVRRRQ